MCTMESLRVLELYSGIGGMHYALKGELLSSRLYLVRSITIDWLETDSRYVVFYRSTLPCPECPGPNT